MKLTRLAGIDVYIHWSFWILPAWIAYSALGTGGGILAAVGSVIFVFAVFGCVVLHEFGHALAARHYGIGTHDITLYPIGGVASLERIPTRPGQELVIALAGPLVNVVIAAALFAVLTIGPGFTLGLIFPMGGSFLAWLMAVNIFLVVFNLLPAFPMDGGRVLRALLATRMPYKSATMIAGKVGQGAALLLGLVGLFTTWNLLLVAIFVFLAATAELARVRLARPEFAAASRPSPPRRRETVMVPSIEKDRIVWVPSRADSFGGGARVVRGWYR